ncbi:toprim domain-containing protein, partial [Endothiovibrio diazotrophicus]
LDADAEDQALLAQVVDYYHQTLKQTPEALEYLERRGLNHPELIEHFKLGVANRTLAYRLPEKNRKAGAEIRGRLQALGILRKSGHEHFNGSLVIPVIMPRDGRYADAPGGSASANDGVVTEIYGRKLNDNLRKGTAYHLYLPGPHRGVFNAEALECSREVILCESLIDALTFWAAGFRNVTTSYGVNGFTDELLAALKHHGTERVLIAYDRDEAGERAAAELAEKLTREGIDAYRIHFPKGMDANEYACQVKPAGKSLGVAIRSAVWLGKGQAPERESVPAVREEMAAKRETPPLSLAAPATSAPEELPAPPAAPAPLPASVLPEPPKAEVEAEVSDS